MLLASSADGSIEIPFSSTKAGFSSPPLLAIADDGLEKLLWQINQITSQSIFSN
jgi:hypothetical protein